MATGALIGRQAASTYPTGMLSCLKLFQKKEQKPGNYTIDIYDFVYHNQLGQEYRALCVLKCESYLTWISLNHTGMQQLIRQRNLIRAKLHLYFFHHREIQFCYEYSMVR